MKTQHLLQVSLGILLVMALPADRALSSKPFPGDSAQVPHDELSGGVR